MKSVITEVKAQYTSKRSTNDSGRARLIKELAVYEYLRESLHIPKLIEKKIGNNIFFKAQTLSGISLKQLLKINDSYNSAPIEWTDAKVYLKQYIEAEMDLLDKGALYRDLNLEHILFSDNKTYFVDLESTVLKNENDEWLFNDMRGTWETMAPEEFRGSGKLDARTVTYRVAVIAHLMLAGKLPFEQSSNTRSKTHSIRLKHPAKISHSLDTHVRRVFESALQREPVRRYKDPMSFLLSLVKWPLRLSKNNGN
jgi:serine/threonine protein kinase